MTPHEFVPSDPAVNLSIRCSVPGCGLIEESNIHKFVEEQLDKGEAGKAYADLFDPTVSKEQIEKDDTALKEIIQRQEDESK